MARFCLTYGVSITEYRHLTMGQRAAWNVEAARIIAERKGT